jgi:hypothetical protein
MLTGNGQSVDERATQARIRLWDRRPVIADVLVRPGLIAHRGSDPSFLRAVSTPRGAGVQVLLLALFEAQTRPGNRLAGRPTDLQLRPGSGGAQTSWLQAAALPTIDRTSQRSASRSPDDNRYGQLRTAMQQLHRAGRIGIEGTGRGAYEGFRLFDESVDNLIGEAAYTVPKDEPVITVPVEFVINGWVHTLTDNEIITFLHLLRVCDEATDETNPQGWVPIPTKGWTTTFGDDRGFEAHRELNRFGLIQIERPEARRADGTVAAEEEEIPWEAHRYRIVRERLGFRAVNVVLEALKVKHSLDADEALFFTGSNRHPDGWSRGPAVEAIEQARLGVPGHVLSK